MKLTGRSGYEVVRSLRRRAGDAGNTFSAGSLISDRATKRAMIGDRERQMCTRSAVAGDPDPQHGPGTDQGRCRRVPTGARNADLAAAFIGFLLSREGQGILADRTPLLPLIPTRAPGTQIERQVRNHIGTFLPVRLTPGLLTYLDEIKRRDFLYAWETALGR
ncbi:hypothetical protein C4N9_02490 [Pararhodobacter marinus]|uniref:Uncharacterized protein n=1 Tax=Pararhodobacter marinus TaxID=2184063 RepID=A0A2U2CJ22_9RHOB|nr:hypothetical protein [Pararhodobacter marinus]PWE31887.1 hypothetical protein C4N9_02490 [Pararhodobacter marinus]